MLFLEQFLIRIQHLWKKLHNLFGKIPEITGLIIWIHFVNFNGTLINYDWYVIRSDIIGKWKTISSYHVNNYQLSLIYNEALWSGPNLDNIILRNASSIAIIISSYYLLLFGLSGNVKNNCLHHYERSSCFDLSRRFLNAINHKCGRCW